MLPTAGMKFECLHSLFNLPRNSPEIVSSGVKMRQPQEISDGPEMFEMSTTLEDGREEDLRTAYGRAVSKEKIDPKTGNEEDWKDMLRIGKQPVLVVSHRHLPLRLSIF